MSNLVLSTSIEDHSTELLQKITNLFKENVLTDVTLVCDDHTKLEAHQVILAARSRECCDSCSISTHPPRVEESY